MICFSFLYIVMSWRLYRTNLLLFSVIHDEIMVFLYDLFQSPPHGTKFASDVWFSEKFTKEIIAYGVVSFTLELFHFI